MAYVMEEEDVFDHNSLPASDLQARSSGSLPAAIHSQDLEFLTVARSRKPLSHNDLSTELQGILDNKTRKYGSSGLFTGTSYESGFFSDSPASSSSSLYQTNEGQRAASEAEVGFPEQHELDHFNQNELGFLFNDFAEELGGCWKESGRYLLKKECSVENINADYSKVSEKAYQVLLKWKKENGADSSVLDLFKCFNHIGREDVAEKVIDYLPKRIQNACRMILLSSPKKIRCPSMTTAIHNIKETIKDMSVEKQLRVADDEEIHLCVSKSSGKKYLLKQVQEGPDNCILAARLAIPGKQLVAKKRQLRNTCDFLKETKIREDTVNRLKKIVEQLQSKLKKDYFSFCKENVDCTNCEKTKTKLELLEKESSLLHHTLDKMLRANRKLSITGIPTDKIYNLAERTYGICEDHKKMHSEIRKIKRRCSQEFLDVKHEIQEPPVKGEEEVDNLEIDDTLECTLNILQHFARRRKVVQSLTSKRRKESKAVQRNKSDKSKSRSRFYVSVRDSFRYKNDGTAQATPSGLTRTDSKKIKRSFRSKDSKLIRRRKGLTEKPDLQSLHQSTSTSPAALVRRNGNMTDFLGTEDLDLDDPSEAHSQFFRAIDTDSQAKSRGTALLYSSNTIKSSHKKIHKCYSDPYVRDINSTESRKVSQERDCHGEAVLDILTQEYFERERSQSDVQTRNKKQSRDQRIRKPIKKHNKCLDKSQPQDSCLQDSSSDNLSKKRDDSFLNSQLATLGDSSLDKPSEKRDKFTPKNQSAVFGVCSSDKPSEKRDKFTTKNQSAVFGVCSSERPREKRDKSSDVSQSNSLQDSPSVKPNKKRDQQSSMSVISSRIVSEKNNNQEDTTRCENVKWLRDVDTEDIIFV